MAQDTFIVHTMALQNAFIAFICSSESNQQIGHTCHQFKFEFLLEKPARKKWEWIIWQGRLRKPIERNRDNLLRVEHLRRQSGAN